MRKLFVAGLISAGLLAGCNSSEIYVSEAATDKTIMVPAGLSPVAKAIKKPLDPLGGEHLLQVAPFKLWLWRCLREHQHESKIPCTLCSLGRV